MAIRILLIVLLLASPCAAATYYIDPDAAAGGDGSLGLPFDAWSDVTWAAGNSYLQKRGTTIRVPGGITVNADGSEGSPIIIGAYGSGARPRILGSTLMDDASDWTDAGSNIWTVGSLAGDVGGLHSVDDTYHLCDKTSEAPTSQGQFYYSSGTLQVYSTSNPHTAYGDLELSIEGTNGDLLALRQSLGSGHYITVQDLEFDYGGGHGIRAGGTSVPATQINITGCIFRYQGGAYLSGTTRYGNAIEFVSAATDSTVSNCRIYQSYDTGLTAQSPGETAYTQDGITFKNNYVENAFWDIEMYNTAGTQSDISVFNNTFVRTSGGAWSNSVRSGTSLVVYLSGTATASNFLFQNNIFYDACEEGTHYAVLGYPPTSGDFTFSYNCWYANQASAWRWDSTDYSWSGWQGLGYDASGSINSDPLLTGHTPSSSSPVINTGTTLASVTDDIDGHSRSYTPYDMGCYELVPGFTGTGLVGVGVN